MTTLHGIPVVFREGMARVPDHREDAVRQVRHGLADVLAWLGEPVGHKPGEPTNVVVMSTDLGLERLVTVIFVDPAYAPKLVLTKDMRSGGASWRWK